MNHNLSPRETALYYKNLMRPYAERAEKNAREIISALEIKIKKPSELIFPKGIRNRITIFFYKVLEEL